ncbi:MAB_1171c family putative transporter [Streptomyces dangxiongensis]|uniref:MAB_1171c family putative transporter n=1 Tax=Streptomyces dangxiongensis TaxID=1442032 RepID=UPI0013CF17E5|nr:MAB_1171c family putative transporter [Streptomyces dangxiongensis]
MSESLSNVVYLFLAVVGLVMAAWKSLALFRDATPTLALIVSMQTCGAVDYAMASPAGYRAIGEMTHQPSFATLPVYVGILICFAHAHILTLLWDPQARKATSSLRRVIAWTLTYAFGASLMTTFFLFADPSGAVDPLRFNTTYADNPMIFLFLLVFLVMLTSGTLNTWRQCRRMELTDPQIQHSVRAFSLAMLAIFGYVVCSAPAIALAALGNHSLDTLGVFGSTCGAIGTVAIFYGLAGAATSAWWRERRDYKFLQPLWDLVVSTVDQNLAFSVRAAQSRHLTVNVTFQLHRRVIEILDGIRVLRPWMSPTPMSAVHLLHDQHIAQGSTWAPLAQQDLDAAVTAASLHDAVRRLQSARQKQGHLGRTSRSQLHAEPVVRLPGDDTPAANERDRLLRVSKALSHPLVSAALREANGAGLPQAGAGANG